MSELELTLLVFEEVVLILGMEAEENGVAVQLPVSIKSVIAMVSEENHLMLFAWERYQYFSDKHKFSSNIDAQMTGAA